MGAIFLKISKTILLIFVFNSAAISQNCNKATKFKRDQSDVPREVCLPKNYMITKVYTRDEPIDFNKDGIADYVFAMEKKNKIIGDSSYLIFYKMNADSTHSLVRKFGNIYPIWFDPNIEAPDLKERRLIDLFDCYLVPDPMYSLEIKSDTIKLTRKMDGRGMEMIKYFYKFDSNQMDWQLVLKKKYSESSSIVYKNESIWLKDFSYCNN